MKAKLVLFALGVALLAAPAAEAIQGPRAVRHIKRYVESDCFEEARRHQASCVGWQVWGCHKLSPSKVRCRSSQEYERRGNWRICYFHTAAVENRQRTWVGLHFGRTRCYSENGNPIP